MNHLREIHELLPTPRPQTDHWSFQPIRRPEVPTVKEAGYPNYEVPLNFGLFAPVGTPREIIALLNAEVGKALAMADVQKRFAVQGFVVAPSKPEELAAIVRADVAQWAKVVKAAGIRVN